MAKPLVDVHCINAPNCKYPVAIRLTMSDGSVQTYTLDSAMSPKVMKAKSEFEQSIEISIGYQYLPKKRKNRIHRSER